MSQSIPIQNRVVRIQAVRHQEVVALLEAVIPAKVEGRIDQTIRRDTGISAHQLHPLFQLVSNKFYDLFVKSIFRKQKVGVFNTNEATFPTRAAYT